jgi:hypothetical protein
LKGEFIVALTIIGTIVIIGLVLRYGASSVPLAQEGVQGTQGIMNDLTLKGSGYSYYPPGETASGG